MHQMGNAIICVIRPAVHCKPIATNRPHPGVKPARQVSASTMALPSAAPLSKA